jgi:hypothetical protein
MHATFGWRLPRWYRLQVMGTFGVAVAVGIVVLAAGPSSASFAVLLAVAVCWNAYWFLLRIVYQLEVADGVLRWWAPLRTGHVPIGEVVAIRPSRIYGHVVTTRRGTILVAFASAGFEKFAAALQAAQPMVSVRVGGLTRLNYPRGWLAGSGFYRNE